MEHRVHTINGIDHPCLKGEWIAEDARIKECELCTLELLSPEEEEEAMNLWETPVFMPDIFDNEAMNRLFENFVPEETYDLS